MPMVTKANLVDAVAEAAELPRQETERVVNSIFEAMAAALAKGDKIELRGFGSFRVRQRQPRAARNPKTRRPCSPSEACAVLSSLEARPGLAKSRRGRYRAPAIPRPSPSPGTAP